METKHPFWGAITMPMIGYVPFPVPWTSVDILLLTAALHFIVLPQPSLITSCFTEPHVRPSRLLFSAFSSLFRSLYLQPVRGFCHTVRAEVWNLDTRGKKHPLRGKLASVSTRGRGCLFCVRADQEGESWAPSRSERSQPATTQPPRRLLRSSCRHLRLH